MKQYYPRWPTRSPDPFVNILCVVIFVFFGLLTLATSLILLIPVALGFTAIAILRWYHLRPRGYENPAIAAAVDQHTISANFPDPQTFGEAYRQRLIDAWQPCLPVPPLLSAIADVAADIYQREALTNPLPPIPADPVDQGIWRDEARIHAQKMHNAPATLGLFVDVLTQSFDVFRETLPMPALIDRAAFDSWGDRVPALTIPAHQLLDDPDSFFQAMALPFFSRDAIGLRLFRELRAGLAEGELANTPLATLLEVPVPFELPPETRFSGHWILSPPGRGKTTLLHAMVMDDIRVPGASLILMDSKGDLIEPIRRLKEIEDRLIIIDPDPTNPVAINPLDIASADLAQTVDLLEYLFASLLEFKMTAMQTTLFRGVLRALVMAVPNPTLDTFRDLLTNGDGKYKQYIAQLPPDLQDFFKNDFNEKNYADRRREVLQRLRLLLDNETMRAMLTAPATRFRIGDAMDNGKIVVINNSKARLGDQGAEFFGRFFIAQVLAAAQQRSNRRPADKPPVYFYIDECQNVIARDEKIPTILDECRSQNIALIMAHQRTKQIESANVLDALTNCAIRFANSDEEARYLASRLRTSEEFLQSLQRGRFAAFVRDLTSQAVAVSVNRVDFSAYEQLTSAEHGALQQRMREAYGPPVGTTSLQSRHALDPDGDLGTAGALASSADPARGVTAPLPQAPRLAPEHSTQHCGETEGAGDWR